MANYVQNINVFVGDGFGTSPRQRFGISAGIAGELGAEISGGFEVGGASEQSQLASQRRATGSPSIGNPYANIRSKQSQPLGHNTAPRDQEADHSLSRKHLPGTQDLNNTSTSVYTSQHQASASGDFPSVILVSSTPIKSHTKSSKRGQTTTKKITKA